MEQSSADTPACARSILNFQLVPDQDPAALFLKLQQHLQTREFPDVQARLLQATRPMHLSPSAPFVALARRSTSAVYQREPYLVPLVGDTGSLASLAGALQLPTLYRGTVFFTQCKADQVKQPFLNSGEWERNIKQLALILLEVGQLATSKSVL
jgi:hypothetical protein